MGIKRTGVLTFLFTDIVGSSPLWEKAPARMAELVGVHRRIVSDAVSGAGGDLVREKGEGDSTFSVFPRPSAAARAVMTLQTMLHSETWDPPDMAVRVRAALHSGVAYQDPSEGRHDYNSPTINRCARLRGLAHGGQTLLSEACYHLLCDEWPDVPALDLGLHTLRGMGRPERVYQLVCPSPVPADFLPIGSPNSPRHNLATPMTLFVGRASELNDVRRRLAESRLVTLSGLGGAGKTRLAQEVARGLVETDRDGYPDGAWHVMLDGETDPAGAVAAALAAPPLPGLSAAAALSAFLEKRRCLLLLDGGERGVVRPLIDRLLSSCPGVRVLAVAHAPLGMAGERSVLAAERAVAVGPLSLPREGVADEQGVLASDAGALFDDRARATSPDFALTPRTAPHVASLCRSLDGLPLALVLAAACLPTLGLAPLARRLASPAADLDTVALLDRLTAAGDDGDAASRRTLVGALDLGYEQLGPDERRLLARLSSFVGGWTLEDAEAVCGPSAGAVVVGLGALVRRSLVVREEREGLVRYRLPGLVAHYARRRLEEAGEAGEADRRHRDHFAALVERAAPHLGGDDAADWLDALEADRGNLLAALARFEPEAAEAGLVAARALYPFWSRRGYAAEGRAALTRLLGAGGAAAADDAAGALTARGALAWGVGDYAAARADFEAARARRAAQGDRRGVADADNNLGCVAWDEGDFVRARGLMEDALAVMEEMDDAEGVAATCGNLAGLSLDEGDVTQAEALLERALSLDRARRDLWAVATSLDALGGAALRRGDRRAARERHEEALKLRRELRDRPGVAESLEGLAATRSDDAPALAAALLGAAEGLREAAECPLPPRRRIERTRLTDALRAALPETYDDDWRRGYEHGWEEAIHAALRAAGDAAAQPLRGRSPSRASGDG